MRLDKLTVKLQEALQDAISFATELGNQQVFPEHLFYTCLRQDESIIASVLDKLGIPVRNKPTCLPAGRDRTRKSVNYVYELYSFLSEKAPGF